MSEDSQLDIGEQVLEKIHTNMGIDAEWSVWAGPGFTWYPHRLAQHVWSEPPAGDDDGEECCLHAQITVFRDVPEDDELYELLGQVNCYAPLSALIYDPQDRRLFLHCKAYIDEEDRNWLEPLFSRAVTVQAILAERLLEDEDFQEVGGEPAIAEHPLNGPRPDPDNALSRMHVLVPKGRQPSWFDEEEDPDGPFGNAGPDAPYMHPRPGGRKPACTPTALFTATNASPHPAMEKACLQRLLLARSSGLTGHRTANALNLAETQEWTWVPMLGAWCDLDGLMNFMTFVPDRRHEESLVSNLFMIFDARVKWVLGKRKAEREK